MDTVDLFYLKRQRKLSLRFLSAYLLHQNIQTYTHDSIEDACTALSLYKVPCQPHKRNLPLCFLRQISSLAIVLATLLCFQSQRPLLRA